MAKTLDGIHFKLPTPFTDDGALDTGPYARLVGNARDAGCRGVVCLGVMGEAPRHSIDQPTQMELDELLASMDLSA